MIIAYCIFFALLAYGCYAIDLQLPSLRAHPLPPGPRRRPIVGNVADLPARGSKGWEHWLKHKDQYGPISSVTTMGQTVVILNKVEVASELLEKKSSIYSARPEAVFANELSVYLSQDTERGEDIGPLIRVSFHHAVPGLTFKRAGWDRTVTLNSSGNVVRAHRKYMAHLLGSKKAVGSFALQQDVETRRLLVHLLEQPGEFLVHLSRLTSGLMLKILYDYNIEPQGPDSLMDLVNLSMSQFVQAIEPGAWLVDSFPLLKYLPKWLPGMGFHHTAREWGQVLAAMAERPYAFVAHQMSAGNNQSSYVSKHIEELDRKPTLEEEYTIKWTAATMFAGGADTTPSALSTFFLAMALFPDSQRAAQKELDEIVGDRLPVGEDRDRLPYVNALIQEVLRWHPVVPMGVPRRSTSEDLYGGYRIPNDAIVVANIWAFTHDPELYPDPSAFTPERFLGDDPQLDPSRLVFGFGRRICPGRFLADSTLFLSIARSLKIFNIAKIVQHGQEIDPPVDFTPGVVSHPSPYEVSVRPRSAHCEALVRSLESFQTKGDSELLDIAVKQEAKA